MVSAKKIVATFAVVAATTVNAQDDAIVQGTRASPGEFTYLASLQTFQGFHFCAGVLIDTKTIVTAAHCVANGQTNFQIKLNTINIRQGNLVRPRAITVNPGYNGQGVDNDIAVIELTQPYTTVSPIPYDVTTGVPQGSAVIAGYGRTRGGGQGSDNLLKIKVPIVPAATCQLASPIFNGLTQNMICMGFANGAIDGGACQGDSGGPIVQDGTLLGVTSWGSADCSSHGVYTRINRYTSWIKTQRDRIQGNGGSNGGGNGNGRCECIGEAGFDQGETCARWANVDFSWCYSRTPCEGSTPSERYEGVFWFKCNPSRFDLFSLFERESSAQQNQLTSMWEPNKDFVVNRAEQGAVQAENEGQFSALAVGGMGAGIMGVACAGAFVLYKRTQGQKQILENQVAIDIAGGASNPDFENKA